MALNKNTIYFKSPYPEYQGYRVGRISNKGDSYFVSITKPNSYEPLVANRTSRRSTRSSNKAEAVGRSHQIASEIYAMFDSGLNISRSPFDQLIDNGRKRHLDKSILKPKLKFWQFFYDFTFDTFENTEKSERYKPDESDERGGTTYAQLRFGLYQQMREQNPQYDPVINRTNDHWDYFLDEFDNAYQHYMGCGPDIYDYYFMQIIDSSHNGADFVKYHSRQCAIYDYFYAYDGDKDAVGLLYDHLSFNEAKVLKGLENKYKNEKEREENPYPARLQKISVKDKNLYNSMDKSSQSKLNIKFENPFNCPKITDLLPAYYKDAKWNTISDNNRKATPQLISKCIEIIGDKPINQIYRSDGKEIAKYLDNYQHVKTASQRIAHNTILDYTKALKGFLNWAMDVKNESVIPAVEWLTGNPFTGVDTSYLADYGLPPRGYEALKSDQLKALFKLDMVEQDRLLLNILAMTGMRLNEVQLLEWHQLKRGTTEVDKHIRYFDLTGSKLKNDRYSLRNVVLPSLLQLPEEGVGRIFNYTGGRGETTSREASKQINKYFHTIRFPDGHADIVKPYQQDNRKVVHSLRNNMRGFLINLRNPAVAPEVIDWICGWGAKDGQSESVGRASYGADPDLITKYYALERLDFSFLKTPRLTDERAPIA